MGSSGAPVGDRVRRWLLLALPPFALCAAVLIFVQRMTPRTWIGGAMSTAAYLITQPYVALRYFGTFLWPSDLSADYDVSAVTGAGDPRFLIGFGFVLILMTGAIICCMSKRFLPRRLRACLVYHRAFADISFSAG